MYTCCVFFVGNASLKLFLIREHVLWVEKGFRLLSYVVGPLFHFNDGILLSLHPTLEPTAALVDFFLQPVGEVFSQELVDC